MNDIRALTVRLPEELAAKVEAAAKRHHMSVNTWLCLAAEHAITSRMGVVPGQGDPMPD
jgi:predicted HicB family RNase H-like nuclease